MTRCKDYHSSRAVAIIADSRECCQASAAARAQSLKTARGQKKPSHAHQQHLSHVAGRLSRNFPDKSTMAIGVSPAARLHVAAETFETSSTNQHRDQACRGQQCRERVCARGLCGNKAQALNGGYNRFLALPASAIVLTLMLAAVSHTGVSEQTGQKRSSPPHHSPVYNHPAGERTCAVPSPNDNDDERATRSQ